MRLTHEAVALRKYLILNFREDLNGEKPLCIYLYLYISVYFLLVVTNALPVDNRFDCTASLETFTFCIPEKAQAMKRRSFCASLRNLSFCRSCRYERESAVYHARVSACIQ